MKKVTAFEFKQKVLQQCKLGNPKTIMVYGVPGIGKTSITQQAAKESKRKYFTISLGRIEAYDIKGVPNNSGDYVIWKPPYFWKEVMDTNGECIVHFDEFTLASDDVQGAILDVVLTKTIDNIKLPERTLFILSGNMGGDDGTSARAITSALTGGRGYVYEMTPPRVEEWINFQKPIPQIEQFLMISKRGIYTGPNLKEPFEPWTCPRAWSQLDDTIKELVKVEGIDINDEEVVPLILDLAEAILSPSTVSAFKEFLKDTIIDANALLKGDEVAWNKYKKAKELKRSFALDEVVKLCDMQANPKRWKSEDERRENIQTFLNRIVEETNTEAETVATFLSKLTDIDPFICQGVKIKGKDVGAYFDKLLKERLQKNKK